MSEDLFKNELLTQKEVANYFRVVPATIKNWRDQGLISFWRAPGSTRILYYSNDIRDFRNKNTISKKGGDTKTKTKELKGKPVVSAKKEWRI